MKNLKKLFIAAFSVVLLFASCKKDENIVPILPSNSSFLVGDSINIFVGRPYSYWSIVGRIQVYDTVDGFVTGPTFFHANQTGPNTFSSVDTALSLNYVFLCNNNFNFNLQNYQTDSSGNVRLLIETKHSGNWVSQIDTVIKSNFGYKVSYTYLNNWSAKPYVIDSALIH